MSSANGDTPQSTNNLQSWAIMRLVQLSGRSWWVALYRDGHQLFEWGTLTNTVLTPLGLGRTSRWEEAPKDGMVSMRLLCPNGQMGELWGTPHRFFQVKCAVRSIGQAQSHMQAHLIGLVDTPSGGCQCWAWEPQTGRIRAFRDHIYGMAYAQMGALSLEVQGLRL